MVSPAQSTTSDWQLHSYIWIFLDLEQNATLQECM